MADQTQSFDAYYEREIAPVLRAREADRKRSVRMFRFSGANGIALAAAILVWRHLAGGIEDVAWFVAAVFAFGGFGLGAAMLASTARGVKEVLLPRIAAFCGARYSREVSDPGAIERFRSEKLVPSYDQSSFEDEIRGTRGGADYSLFEATLKTRHTDSKGRTTYVTAFRGQLLRVAFPQKFSGRTIVLRDAGMFNAFLSFGTELKRVGLVDPKFEKTFEVLGTDQVEARYLLTPTFMERLLKLETMLKGQKARAAFSGGELLVAIEGGNLFEAGTMFKELASRERVDRVLKEIQSVHGVIDALLAAQQEQGSSPTESDR